MKINTGSKISRSIKILLLFLFIVNLSEGLFSPLFAIFITDFIIGATLKTVGFAMAFYAVTKSIIQVPIARMIDRRKGEKDDFYVMMIGAVLGIIYTFGLIFIKLPWHLYSLAILQGIGGACLMAAYYGIFARHVDKGSEGFEWSLFSVGGLTMSVAIGAAVGGVFTDIFGFTTIFLTAGVLKIIATILLSFLYLCLIKFKKK